MFRALFSSRFGKFWSARTTTARRSPRRPRLEQLEDRLTPSVLPQPVSIASTGTAMGDNVSSLISGSVSRNGQYEVFTSSADNLVSGLPTHGSENVYRRDLVNGSTALVSINSTGTGGGSGFAANAVLTPDGRYVAFVSNANNLVSNVSGTQVLVRDMTLGQTFLVSASSNGTPGNGPSEDGNPGDAPTISETSNGQLIVAYFSNASNLTANDTSPNRQVFLTTLNLDAGGAIQTGSRSTILVSATSTGNGGNSTSTNPVLSPNGSTLTFTSQASNLNVPGGYNDNIPLRFNNLFQYSLASQTLTLLSAEPTLGTAATGNAVSTMAPNSVSADGRYAVFTSSSDNLVPGIPTYGITNVYRRDLVNGTTSLVSINSSGTACGDGGSQYPALTPDGRYVAFISSANDLVSNSNGRPQVLVRDMTLGQTFLVSAAPNGDPSNGGFTFGDNMPSISETSSGQLVIAYLCNATNLTSNDTSTNAQLFVTTLNLDSTTGAIQSGSLATSLISAASNGNGGNGTSSNLALSKDGSTVAFLSTSTNLAGVGSGNGQAQLYVCTLATGQLTQVNPAGGQVTSFPGISDSGQFLTYRFSTTQMTEILGWNSATGQNKAIAQSGNFTQLGSPVLSGDGSTIAFTGTSSSAFLLPNVFVTSTWQSGNPNPIPITGNPDNTELEAAGQAMLSDNGQILAYGWDQGGGSLGDVTALFVTNLKTNVTQQVGSMTPGNTALLDDPTPLTVSADGSTVVFNSTYNLVPGTIDFIAGQSNVFAYNVAGNTTSLVSAKAPGLFTADAVTQDASLSDNGRYIAFDSDANDLLGNLAPSSNMVFAEDLQQGVPVVISVNTSGGTDAFSSADEPAISGDGSIVAFRSSDIKLSTIHDTISGYQIYSRNWLAANPTTTMVSSNSAGTNGGNHNSENPSISDNGQVIAFDSTATDLVSNDAAGGSQVFVRIGTNPTLLVSPSGDGSNGGNAGSTSPVVSSLGNVVVFNSSATNLVAGVTVPLPSGTPPVNVYATVVGQTTPAVSVSASSRPYNGLPITATATVNGQSSLQGVSPTLTYYSGSSAGGTPLASAPVDAGTYTVVATFPGSQDFTSSSSSPVTFMITPVTLTVTGITAGNKTYDGTTTATLNVNNAALQGVVNADAVTLNTGNAGGTFASRDAGSNIVVTVSGLTISGPTVTAGDYTLAQPTTTASITAANLTVTGITAGNKAYDGTTAATLNVSNALLVGVVNGEAVALNTSNARGTFASRDAGSNLVVTVSGLTISGPTVTAGDYTLTQPTTTADITSAGLTVIGITAGNKIYDGTTAATLNVAGARLTGVRSGDSVQLDTSHASGAFSSRNVGNNLVVTISGLTLSGLQASDYTLTQPTTTASITPFALTISATGQNKIYDGTTQATVTLTDNRFAGDQFSDSFTSASFASKNVTSTPQTVSVSGISISGPDAGNYTVNPTATTTASITPAALTVTGITASNKVYDGTTKATINVTNARLQGVVGGDSVTLNTKNASGVFASRNAGIGITVIVSGLTIAGPAVTAGDYTLTQATTTANITPAALTVTGLTASNKVYDGTTAAILNTNNAKLLGVRSGDTVTLNSSNAGGNFSGKNVGSNLAVTVTGLGLSGPQAGNYLLSQPMLKASITPRPITVTAAADTKTYDGTTVSFQKPTITSGSLAGDTANFVQTFSSSNAGRNLTLTPSGSVNDGNGGKDYVVMFVRNTHGEIDPATLTVQAIDRTWIIGQPMPALTYAISGFIGVDLPGTIHGSMVLSTTATADSLPGTYLISFSQEKLSAANYVFEYLSGTLTVTGLPGA